MTNSLRRLDELRGLKLLATDGEIGRAKDFLFDERTWIVRYLVADTGTWLPKRKVLISPVFVGGLDDENRLSIDLTKKTIEASPPLDEHAPVSRQKELELYSYYQIPPYWVGPRAWGVHPTLDAMRAARKRQPEREEGEIDPGGGGSESLRSVHELMGYHISATNDDIGHVEDFIADTSHWAIRWLVVDTRNWLPGRKVLVDPRWADAVSWDERKLHLSLTKQQIESSPDFHPDEPITEALEAKLYAHYDRPDRRPEEGKTGT